MSTYAVAVWDPSKAAETLTWLAELDGTKMTFGSEDEALAAAGEMVDQHPEEIEWAIYELPF